MKSDPELSPLEWNFDNVPESELIACYYWEYARESAFLREFKNRWDAWNRSDHCPDEIFNGMERIEQNSPQVFARLQALWECPSFPSAWQGLPNRREP